MYFFFFLLLLGSRTPTIAARDFVRDSRFDIISKFLNEKRRNSTRAEFTTQLNPEQEETGDSSDSSTFIGITNTIEGMTPQYFRATFCGSEDSIIGTFRLWL